MPLIASRTVALAVTLTLTAAACSRPERRHAPLSEAGTAKTLKPEPAAITYAFPVRPASAASYGRSHHDYPATDVFAPCGTMVVAASAGVVDEVSRVDSWDPKTNDGALRGGIWTSVVGDDGVRYYGSHLSAVEPGIEPGVRLRTGQELGRVGKTGNARSTPCHLHFGLSPPCGPGDWEVRRGVVYPWPYLDSWREGGQRSPRDEVAAWNARHHAC
jgi:murein DD-endopeptidase MepM/ murein hydrolase activator NlpD